MELSKKWSIPLIVIALIFSLGLVSASYIAVGGLIKSKNINASITVTGSAKKQIKSDFAVWNCKFSSQTQNLSEAYSIIKKNQIVVKKYLIDKGIPETEMSVMAINTISNYVRNYQGVQTSVIESYKLTQNIEIKTSDVSKIFTVSKESTELIDKGVEFESNPPQYFYTKIADLKIDMLALATKDAKDRAEKIALNAGTQIIGVKSSRMGVFQIRPLYSDEISDYGMNDTTSIDKEIMAVMNCEFKAK